MIDFNLNEKLIEKLKQNILSGHIAHAYIFEGNSNSDKRDFTDKFMSAILCNEMPGKGCGQCVQCRKIQNGNHEDIFYVSGSGKTCSVKDADIEALQQFMMNKPIGIINMAVIENADTMTLRAQNRLLKTLEEPLGNAVIMLLSENIENLAPTVLSRCVKYRLESPASFAYEENAETIRLVMSKAPFYKVKSAIDDLAAEKGSAEKFLDELENRYREIMLTDIAVENITKEEIFDRISDIEEAGREIKFGAAKGYALKKMILRMKEFI